MDTTASAPNYVKYVTSGTIIGAKYILWKMIGRGTSSTVWFASDLNDVTKLYAIKVQFFGLAKSAAREQEILNKVCELGKEKGLLEHSHIVEIIDTVDYCPLPSSPKFKLMCTVFKAYAGNLMMLMRSKEFCRGMEPVMVKDITKQILASLIFLKKQMGVVYMDLKPQNLIFEAEISYYAKIVKLISDSGIQEAYKATMASITSKKLKAAFNRILKKLIKDIDDVENILKISDESESDDEDEEFDDNFTKLAKLDKSKQRQIPKKSGKISVETVVEIELNDSDEAGDSDECSDGEQDDLIPLTKEDYDADEASANRCQQETDRPSKTELLNENKVDLMSKYNFAKKRFLVNEQDTSTFNIPKNMKLTIALTDFGSAKYADQTRNREIQTRLYRSPESILGFLFDKKKEIYYDYSTDVWSLACMVYEFMTGENLFNPNKEADSKMSLSMDHHQLFLFFRHLGDIPKKMQTDSLRGKYLFDGSCAGKGSDICGIKMNKAKHDKDLLFKRLHETHGIEAEEAKMCADFLKFCLVYNPTERPSFEKVYMHPWLQTKI